MTSTSIPFKEQRRSFGAHLIGYLLVATLLGLAAGLSRSIWRFAAGTLPDQYLLEGVLVNGALAVSCAVLVAPYYLLLGRFLPRFAAYTSAFGILFVFWGLNTEIPYRAPLSADAETLRSELTAYVLGLIAFTAIGGWLLSQATLGRLVKRAAVGGMALALVTAGLAAYSWKINPSNAAPLNLQPTAKEHPHVFVVLVDTLRADYLSCYGFPQETSPELDALAADGVLFRWAFSHAPWTRPSCGSLLTGRYPPEIGLRGLWAPLPKHIPILPQLMKEEGYTTAGLVSSVHVSAQFGFDKGFDLLDIGKSYYGWVGVKTALTRLRLIRPREIFPQFSAAELTDLTISYLDGARASSDPVFMYLHYLDPHGPYRPPEAEDRWREFADERGKALDVPPDNFPAPGVELGEAEVDAMVARYKAEIAYFDHHFARFLSYLKEQDMYDDSLIVVTADHGEEFLEHGGWGHGHSLHKELLNVPLIVKYPKSTGVAGEVVDTPVGLVDVLPTVEAVLGADWPDFELRGHSLLASPSDRTIYADNWTSQERQRTLYMGTDKLVQTVDARGAILEEQFFSVASDPNEDGEGFVPADLPEERLDAMRRELADIDTAGIVIESIIPDGDTRAELEDLGYTGED